MKNFIIEGLDRLGKDLLIENIQHRLGYKMVCHRSKPLALELYAHDKDNSLMTYQKECFSNDMSLLWVAENNFSLAGIIFNRSWIGEFVYGPIYRGYSAEYIFELEHFYALEKMRHTCLILLTEDFSKSAHFVDDGLSFDVTKRQQEQNRFEHAFERSRIPFKRKVCVTAENGKFRDAQEILNEVLSVGE